MDLMSFFAMLYKNGVTITITIKATNPGTTAPSKEPVEHEQFVANCDCGWTSVYSSPEAAERGLRTHQNRHCVLYAEKFEWLRNQQNDQTLHPD